MKLELKTENEKYSNSFLLICRTISLITLLVVLCDISIKLGIISRHYQIEYTCRLLSIEKSKSNFNKLLRLSTLKNKQRVWEFCRDFVK